MARLVTPAGRPHDPFVTRESLMKALGEVTTAEGIQASSRETFKGAIFGRDSLEVGLDVAESMPDLVRRILLSVVRHIGIDFDELSEEEPGKGLHEYRARVIGGEVVADEQQQLLEKLSAIWGGSSDSVTYFGAADTGALFLDLLWRYVEQHGVEILDTAFVHARSGEQMTIGQAVVSSANWYVSKIRQSSIGLMEFKRINPNGHWFQVMRDGHDGMVDNSGRQANPNAPIAAIEIQAVAYSGLHAAARLLPDHPDARTWVETATLVRDKTIELLWSEEEQFFFRAIYRDSAGNPTVLRAIDTAAGELLRSGFFDGLEESQQEKFVVALVERLFSSQFLTPVGPRMLSDTHAHLFDYASYQGSSVVWPTVVKRIADGLYRCGLTALGADLDARLLHCCESYGDFPEFVFVEKDGTPVFRTTQSGRTLVSGSRPMTVQAWTASAAFGAFTRSPQAESKGWRRELEQRVCDALWEPHSVSIDDSSGKAAEARFMAQKGHGTPGLSAGWNTD